MKTHKKIYVANAKLLEDWTKFGAQLLTIDDPFDLVKCDAFIENANKLKDDAMRPAITENEHNTKQMKQNTEQTKLNTMRVYKFFAKEVLPDIAGSKKS